MPLNYDPSTSGTGAAPPSRNVTSALGANSDSSSTSYSSCIVIQEVTAAQGQVPRSVILQGPGLPFMGTEWGSENALFTTWLPGNADEATQHNLGPREVPKQWQGEWNLTRMITAPSLSVMGAGNPQTLVDPFALATALDTIFQAGQRLRVTWNVTSASNSNAQGKIVREGRAKSWNFKFTRIQDIAWDITFEWMSRGQRQQATTTVRDGSLDAAAAALNIQQANLASSLAGAAFLSSNAAIPGSASSLTLGQLENLANAPTALVNSFGRSILQVQNQLQQVADIATTLASQPVQIANAAINLAKNALAQANQVVDQMGQIPMEIMSLRNNVSDMMRSFQYFGGVSDATYQSTLAAAKLIASMQQQASVSPLTGSLSPQASSAGQGDTLSVYATKDGDTLASISVQFYGTMDHGQDIAQANRMPWYQPSFPKGRILIIPVLRSSQRGS